MGLNKQKGNMYPWVTHTYNAIKGKCPHDCPYCYMKRFPQKSVRLDKKEFKTDLGTGNTIFVGSSCDMWADKIPYQWIVDVLNHCKKYLYNSYLFQSKNPKRFFDFIDNYFDGDWHSPLNVDIPIGGANKIIFATTLETNRDTGSNAPEPSERVSWMWEFTDRKYQHFKRMVSIEPIMDFDITEFSQMLWNIEPDFVSIGADSKNNGLKEPSRKKILQLIEYLNTFTDVKIKDNLNRIIKEK